MPVDHSLVQENHGVLKNVRVPIRPHFGVIALAPKEADIVDSIPPGYFGGNMDNWRLGKGATVYYPVAVPGGLFSVGDSHASQGVSGIVRHCDRMLSDRHVSANCAQTTRTSRHCTCRSALPAGRNPYSGRRRQAAHNVWKSEPTPTMIEEQPNQRQ